jgi:hypothetical protein
MRRFLNDLFLQCSPVTLWGQGLISIAVCFMATASNCVCHGQESGEKKLFRQVRKTNSFMTWSEVSQSNDRSLLSGERSRSIRGCVGGLDEEITLEPMPEDFFAQLGDRFAKAILPEHSRENRLNVVLDKLKSATNGNKLQTFVVSESIRFSDLSGPTLLLSRRAVLKFSAQSTTEQVMLSTSFNANTFRSTLAPRDLVEVWAWDEARGVFNFYEWAIGGVWSFVGSSPKPGDPPSLAASNRCLDCHRTGAPIMKELRRPWNNWESSEHPTPYLTLQGMPHWPVAGQLNGLADALNLEPTIITMIQRFNRKRVAQNRDLLPDGSRNVRNVRFLLKPLFIEQELNLESSRDQAGLSPFATPVSTVPEFAVPAQFFIRQELLGGSAVTGGITGVASAKAKAFKVPNVSMISYRQLLTDKKVGLRGTTSTGLQKISPADTDFAWFTPVRSYVDDQLIDLLLSENIVNRQFVAAVCNVDLERPVLSEALSKIFSLPNLLPNTVVIPATVPVDHRDHPVTKHVLAALATAADSTPEHRLFDLLSADDPIQDLEEAIEQLQNRLPTELSGPASEAALATQFQRMLDLRQAFLRHPRFQRLDETGGNGLLPMPIP